MHLPEQVRSSFQLAAGGDAGIVFLQSGHLNVDLCSVT